MYRSPTGQWFVHRSGDGEVSLVSWGCPSCGDLPVPADYDGDGRVDLGATAPPTGQWFIFRSSDGTLLQAAWGAPAATGDVPVPADYDGDGKADVAVYRSSNGIWFLHRSSDDQLTQIPGAARAAGTCRSPPGTDREPRHAPGAEPAPARFSSR